MTAPPTPLTDHCALLTAIANSHTAPVRDVRRGSVRCAHRRFPARPGAGLCGREDRSPGTIPPAHRRFLRTGLRARVRVRGFRHACSEPARCLQAWHRPGAARLKESKNADAFIAFTSDLPDRWAPDGASGVVLIISSHVSRAARQWLSTQPRIRVCHTPRHASWLNPAELAFSILQRKSSQAVHVGLTRGWVRSPGREDPHGVDRLFSVQGPRDIPCRGRRVPDEWRFYTGLSGSTW